MDDDRKVGLVDLECDVTVVMIVMVEQALDRGEDSYTVPHELATQMFPAHWAVPRALTAADARPMSFVATDAED